MASDQARRNHNRVRMVVADGLAFFGKPGGMITETDDNKYSMGYTRSATYRITKMDMVLCVIKKYYRYVQISWLCRTNRSTPAFKLNSHQKIFIIRFFMGEKCFVWRSDSCWKNGSILSYKSNDSTDYVLLYGQTIRWFTLTFNVVRILFLWWSMVHMWSVQLSGM